MPVVGDDGRAHPPAPSRYSPDLRWFVPTFSDDLAETRGLRGVWPEDLELSHAPALVQRLATRGVWLEQEPIAVDPRTPVALVAMFPGL